MQPWPQDVWIVLCEPLGQQDRSRMSGVEIRPCRDCGTKVAVDPETLSKSIVHPSRHGREVQCLCTTCAGSNYDTSTIELLLK